MTLYDVKQTGESITRPHIRIAPLREDKASKMVGGVVQARAKLQAGATSVIDGDMYVFFDGGRPGTALFELHLPSVGVQHAILCFDLV